MSSPIPPNEIPGWSDFYEIAKTAALTRTDRIDDKSFTDGNMWNIIAGVAAALGEEDARIGLQLFLKTFFSTASEADLDALALDHFNLVRLPGLEAQGIAKFSRPVAGSTQLIPLGFQISTADGIIFQTKGAINLVGTEVEVLIEAINIGVPGNVAANTIVLLVDALSDPSIVVNNPELMAGGGIEETDSKFRVRILQFFQTLRRGTALALETGALFVPGVSEASTDDSVFPPIVYIADATGTANSALVSAVLAELINWRAAGVVVTVAAATVTEIPVTMIVIFESGFDVLAVRQAVIDAVVVAVNTSGIGESLFVSQIIGPAQAVQGVSSVLVTNPPGTIIPAPSEALRTKDSLVNIS